MADKFKACSVDDCNRNAHSSVGGVKGWCQGHYVRWKTYGEIRQDEPLKEYVRGRTCTMDGCGSPALAKGYCSKHYDYLRRHGTADHALLKVPNGETTRWIDDHAGFDGDGCLIWPFSQYPSGYGQTMVDGKGQHATRVMCEKVHGPSPSPTHEAAHSCGKGHLGCIAPNHLRWATPIENASDKEVHGTVARGTKNGHAKINEDDVRYIRRMRGVITQAELADQFGISRPHVSGIQSRREWSWLE